VSLVDRINRYIASWVHRHRPHIAVKGDDLVIMAAGERKTLRLADLSSAMLSYRDVYAAKAVVLVLGFPNGINIEIFQDDPSWFDLTAALDRSGRIAVPSREWQLRFLAAGDDASALDLLNLR